MIFPLTERRSEFLHNKKPHMNARADHTLEPTVKATKLSNAHLDALEEEAIFILREVAASFERPTLLFSGGKDSLVLLKCGGYLTQNKDGFFFKCIEVGVAKLCRFYRGFKRVVGSGVHVRLFVVQKISRKINAKGAGRIRGCPHPWSGPRSRSCWAGLGLRSTHANLLTTSAAGAPP